MPIGRQFILPILLVSFVGSLLIFTREYTEEQVYRSRVQSCDITVHTFGPNGRVWAEDAKGKKIATFSDWEYGMMFMDAVCSQPH